MKPDISKSMSLIAASLNAKFYLNDRFVSFDEVFAYTGLLPAIARRADQLCSLCLGYGLGISFEEAEGSLLGSRVVFDDVTPNVLRLLCMTDVVNELIQGGPSKDYTPLDELMYD
ncbi:MULTISPECIES: type IV secretion IcmS family protein [Legionella]|uniref:Type IV secretion protein IcmS n=1 Tax=Legionella septentrionalis TaxID=2498109 RepID=A0A433JJ77_9GAMM|nr:MULTISPECIES: type IV secretion IcmS family protein [Legionella]MCP0913200.1 type IV secretion protein IcmS [Legionella sp. 27cVA30]RUQ88041.1 type IV secretion protein IcmS [Legionella septentrionalis]RUR02420.1 type IV secretion protein IcmS [Legionella septentrionalis]RUR10364.1 type IV secretion protein IcmS [Legionella septentrionalis]RUR17078.1 type IV secretion protein IcmS [Legionella septentrionalis]